VSKKDVSTLTKAGRYELREELGRGAMGVVYHAHDPVIGRDVAVKTMHLSEAGTGMSREELVGRFQTEARAAGLLTHPNIVVIYDAGEEEGLFYITMEMVEGRSLQALLDANQSFPLPRVMRLMEQVCSALDFAHQHNVVHRDVKPANLVLTSDDTVKITDFGTAKILQFGTTQTAHAIGTPSYMSPEQVKGKPVDGRSDIFSLGVILYELMTGEKPFPGQNITTVIYKIINEEPIPPRSLDSSIHPGLSAVIARALAKDPALRYQNCHELLDALQNYREVVSPEKTVRMAPVSAQPASAAGRTSATPTRETAAPQAMRPNDTAKHLRSFPTVITEERPSNTRLTLMLSVILLAIIGYAGYRIYPPMVDLWQRAHENAVPPAAALRTVPAGPALTSDAPDTKLDTKTDNRSDAISPSTAPSPVTAPSDAENSAPRSSTPQSIAQTPPAKQVEPFQSAVAANLSKPVSPQKPAALPLSPAPSPAPPPAPAAFESKLRSELEGSALADKVTMHATTNALTLSGQLTFAEHRDLLSLLHSVPAGVRIIDDVEYKEDSKIPPVPASIGWVWIRSQPRGARIVIDNAETGLRTPARVEIQQGEHKVQLKLRGASSPLRTVQVQAGQTMQITETLDVQ
jgi:serine/threonine-protein kinase